MHLGYAGSVASEASTSLPKQRANQPFTPGTRASSACEVGLCVAIASSVAFGHSTPGSSASSFARVERQRFSATT